VRGESSKQGRRRACLPWGKGKRKRKGTLDLAAQWPWQWCGASGAQLLREERGTGEGSKGFAGGFQTFGCGGGIFLGLGLQGFYGCATGLAVIRSRRRGYVTRATWAQPNAAQARRFEQAPMHTTHSICCAE
jgi:hypothetical protein